MGRTVKQDRKQARSALWAVRLQKADCTRNTVAASTCHNDISLSLSLNQQRKGSIRVKPQMVLRTQHQLPKAKTSESDQAANNSHMPIWHALKRDGAWRLHSGIDMRVADGASCSGSHARQAPQSSPAGLSRPQQLHAIADRSAQRGYCVSYTLYLSLDQVWTGGRCRRWSSKCEE